jgi:hypothetical protein
VRKRTRERDAQPRRINPPDVALDAIRKDEICDNALELDRVDLKANARERLAKARERDLLVAVEQQEDATKQHAIDEREETLERNVDAEASEKVNVGGEAVARGGRGRRE